jgi:hypothetical protein
MIAQNIAHQAVLARHHVLFTTAAQLLLDLGGQESARGLARRLNYYGQRSLLVLDELGTSPTMPALPTSSSRSSAAGMNGKVWLSFAKTPPADHRLIFQL